MQAAGVAGAAGNEALIGWSRSPGLLTRGRRNVGVEYLLTGSIWNAELMRGDLGKAVQQLKGESGKGLFVQGANPVWSCGAGIDR